MNKTSVTLEEVASAAEELVRQGKKPTVTAIRERLGRGSRTTIAKHLNTWSEERIAKLIPLAKQVSEQMAEVVGPMREAMEQIAKSVEELGTWRTKSLGLSTSSLEQARKALEQLSMAGEELRSSLDLSAFAKSMEGARESLMAFEGVGKRLGTVFGEQTKAFSQAVSAAAYSPPTPPLPSTASDVMSAQTATFAEAAAPSILDQIAERLERIERRLDRVERAAMNGNSEAEAKV